jgi:hypothetical protein
MSFNKGDKIKYIGLINPCYKYTKNKIYIIDKIDKDNKVWLQKDTKYDWASLYYIKQNFIIVYDLPTKIKVLKELLA